MDDCSDEDMVALAKAPRPRPRLPVGQALPPGREDWTLKQLRGHLSFLLVNNSAG